MRKTRIGLRWAVITLATASLFCASTTFVSTWRSPDARPLRLTGKKVVAVFMSRRPAVRRRAEDAMAREISAHGAQGVPSYTVLSDEEIKDKEATKAKLEGLGFSGAVVMRVVGRETEVSYEPGVVWVGPHYRHFWGGYWVWGWGTVWDPGYLREDKIVKVETLVYSFEQDELVWAGVSKTLNPDRIEDFVSDLAKAISDQMEKDGLLARA
jgi:hypothetical protein